MNSLQATLEMVVTAICCFLQGVLRDLSRVSSGVQETSLKATQSNGDANESGAITTVPDIVSSNGDNSAVTAER
ncbi:hypothetical protein CK203_109667 [Vitis vinifera]|uniref:Uncharacterized protein n=1 Tax=Vitis vinifera TaxID=29760 RepID=A0A438CF60_VITVI|nr:hypothetical protein CK203_109667 [Vitis vinifera]